MAEDKKAQEAQPEQIPSSAPAELRKIEKEYQREVRITKVRPVIRQTFWVVWAVFDAILTVIFIGSITYYLVAGSFADRRQVASLGQNIEALHDVTAESSAQSITAGDVKVFSLGEGRYDLFIELANPNNDWWAEISYSFADGEESTQTFSGFLLPGEQKPLTALYQEFTSRPSGAEFVVNDLTWHRVDSHEISDFDNWLTDHQNFVVDNADYSTDVEIGETNLARSTFTIENKTPYSYWDGKFLVVLLSGGGGVLGVNEVTVAGFESSETRSVTVNWFGDAPSSASTAEVKVITNINFFDEDAYMPLSSEVERDIRDTSFQD